MTAPGANQMALVSALADGVCLTITEIAERCGLERQAISAAACLLIERGWVQRRERGCYDLTADGQTAIAAGEEITCGPRGPMQAAKRPRKITTRDRAWHAMRLLKKFSIDDVIERAGGERHNVGRYILALEGAGYLVALRRQPGNAPSSNGFRRFFLARDTGPKTPLLRNKSREILDPNTNETHRVQMLGRRK